MRGGVGSWSWPRDMRSLLPLRLSFFAGVIACAAAAATTFCNPLNLPYRFQLTTPSRREAADPTMVVFNSTYFLFASKSGGYWHSPDMEQWDFVVPTGLPLEDYAPTVMVLNGSLFFTAFSSRAVYTTVDPFAGIWTKVADLNDYGDPCLFLDAGKVYVYYGCSANEPLHGVELDPTNGWTEVGEPSVTVPVQDWENIGWDVRGDENQGDPKEAGSTVPSVEGSWMSKVNGRYYLQFATPGTQYRSYSDAVYVGDAPLGPFSPTEENPFSHKPSGFASGAGHGSTFQDLQGRYWHIATSTISVRHRFERRLGLYPVHIADDGTMYAETVLGDYPTTLVPAASSPGSHRPPRMHLVSWGAIASASSELSSTENASYVAGNALNEDIRTWWSASGAIGEWLMLDLRRSCSVAGTMQRPAVHLLTRVQINFADQGSTALGRLPKGELYQYYVEVANSTNGTSNASAAATGSAWTKLAGLDRSENERDMPHDYVELETRQTFRYLRLTCLSTAGGSKCSVSGLRVFGACEAVTPPAPVDPASVLVSRNASDARQAMVSWAPAHGATMYVVRYRTALRGKGAGSSAGTKLGVRIAPSGVVPLYHSYQVYGVTSLQINALTVGMDYEFAVDAANANGYASGQ